MFDPYKKSASPYFYIGGFVAVYLSKIAVTVVWPIAYVRWCIDCEKKKTKKKKNNTHTHKSVMIKHTDMSLVKHTDELKSFSKDGTRCPKQWYEVSRTRYGTSRPGIKRFWYDD